MRRPPPPDRSVALVLAALAIVLGARAAAGASRERRFFSAREGVGIEAPGAWTLSLHTGYPEILCVLLHPDGSRISLSAAPTTAPDAKALAEQSRKGLEAQHLAIAKIADGPRGGVLLEAHGARKDTELRQLYLVRGAGAGKRQGIVVTLSTRAATLATAGPAFDWAVAHLALEVPLDAEETAAKPSAHPGGADAGANLPAGR
ncbi:MAG TPA: hypothetical protein VHL80_02795 [Polyangia bacterium]|nr:hypothetical protein [Polyangia bacterium]